MLISTKGRYALRVMADLARNGGEEYVVLMDIAERQNISEKYLEGIVAALSRCGFLQTQRGRGGGYRLARCPEEYAVGDILRVAEGSIAPVSGRRGAGDHLHLRRQRGGQPGHSLRGGHRREEGQKTHHFHGV